MSEVSSLHDGLDPRRGGGRSQPPPLATVYDQDEAMSTISSVSQHVQRRDDYPQRGGRTSADHMGGRGRARSMENLDDITRRYPQDSREDTRGYRRDEGARGRRGSVTVLLLLPPLPDLTLVLHFLNIWVKVGVV